MNPVIMYGVYGFWGNAMSNAISLVGHTSVENDTDESIKQRAIDLVETNTEWDISDWEDWHPKETHQGRLQTAIFSDKIDGRSPENKFLVNYNQFILILFEYNQEDVDKMIKAYSGMLPGVA